jgi:hypothetical protein
MVDAIQFLGKPIPEWNELREGWQWIEMPAFSFIFTARLNLFVPKIVWLCTLSAALWEQNLLIYMQTN